VDTRWLRGVPPDQLEERKKELASYKNAFQNLAAFLETLGEEGSPDYNNPSWAYEQADRNGANRKLRDIIRLLKE